MERAAETPADELATIDPVERGLRSLAITAASGVVVGLIVGGIGGRVVMRISAVAADSDGLLTEGGNRVGDITVVGSIALIVFGGGISGLIGGWILFVSRPWLPQELVRRAVVFAIVLPAMVGVTIIAAENRDFLFLDPAELNIAMFLLLFALFGAAIVPVNAKLHRLMPQPTSATRGSTPPYTAIGFLVPAALVALLLLADEQLGPGAFVLLMGVAASLRSSAPQEGPSANRFHRTITVVGYGSLIAASVTGSLSLAVEIGAIV